MGFGGRTQPSAPWPRRERHLPVRNRDHRRDDQVQQDDAKHRLLIGADDGAGRRHGKRYRRMARCRGQRERGAVGRHRPTERVPHSEPHDRETGQREQGAVSQEAGDGRPQAVDHDDDHDDQEDSGAGNDLARGLLRSGEDTPHDQAGEQRGEHRRRDDLGDLDGLDHSRTIENVIENGDRQWHQNDCQQTHRHQQADDIVHPPPRAHLLRLDDWRYWRHRQRDQRYLHLGWEINLRRDHGGDRRHHDAHRQHCPQQQERMTEEKRRLLPRGTQTEAEHGEHDARLKRQAQPVRSAHEGNCRSRLEAEQPAPKGGSLVATGFPFQPGRHSAGVVSTRVASSIACTRAADEKGLQR